MSRLQILVASLASTFLPFAASAQPAGDQTANAMVKGGVYSCSQLTANQAVYSGQPVVATGTLVDACKTTGTVTRSGKVIVNGKVVATEAQSYGRSQLPGSARVGSLWRRPTSVAFNQDSLPAYVYMDKDGRFGYAVIKSCGNLVTAKPKPIAPKPTPAKPKPIKPTVVNNVVVVNVQQQQQQAQQQAMPATTQTVAAAPVAQPAPAKTVPATLPDTGGMAATGAMAISSIAILWRKYTMSKVAIKLALLG